MKWSVLLLFVGLSCFRSEASARYKPVIIVHGLFDGPEQFQTLTGFIKAAHNGTNVTVLNQWNYFKSLRNLWDQVDSFRSALESELNQAPDGAHLICFSQGGLICRALLSVMPNHNIHTFIALSSPLAGEYLVNVLYRWICGMFGHLHPSICEYWNDPCDHEEYLKHNDFLPVINGEKEHHEDWKENFLKIKKLVLVGGPDDGVITPWQSSHFGFYDCDKNVVEMKDQQFYISDFFGLQTLDSHGDVHVCVQAGVHHTEWYRDHSVFINCIRDFLN